jgi:hypothetical protein
MAKPTEEEKVEQVAVEELRRRYDELCSNFDQIRLRVLAFITGELALASFLFSKGMALPSIIYGFIFFATGVICIMASFTILLTLLRTVSWRSPISRQYIRDIDYKEFPDKTSFLLYVKEAYIRVLDGNSPTISRANKRFDISLVLLVVGVIILMVIKYGQGVILWHTIIHA